MIYIFWRTHTGKKSTAGSVKGYYGGRDIKALERPAAFLEDPHLQLPSQAWRPTGSWLLEASGPAQTREWGEWPGGGRWWWWWGGRQRRGRQAGQDAKKKKKKGRVSQKSPPLKTYFCFIPESLSDLLMSLNFFYFYFFISGPFASLGDGRCNVRPVWWSALLN